MLARLPRLLVAPRSRTQTAILGAVAVGLAIVLAATGVIVPSRPALGASTTLSIIGGLVEVRQAEASYVAATDGEILERGDAVRTGADGRAVLTYFDGSTVTVEPSSELLIEEAAIAADGSTTIEMTQVIGHTWHVVERQLGPGSKYEVHTNAATATVRGTTFEVLVETDEETGEPQTRVQTAKGTVAMRRAATLTSAGEEVLVPQGNVAAARLGRRIGLATPRPEADRVVTVTIGSERSVVVDPVGRANGFRDGKLVLETPGASAERVDGKLVITLPNIPEGLLNARVERSRDDQEEVSVETRVKERGRDEQRAEERARVPRGGGTEIELTVRRGERPDVRVREERRESPTVPPLASARAEDAKTERPARTAPPRTPRPRATGVPSVQLSPLPTFEPARDRRQGGDRGPDSDDKDERKDAERSREPSRLVPDVRIPQIPSGLGKKDR